MSKKSLFFKGAQQQAHETHSMDNRQSNKGKVRYTGEDEGGVIRTDERHMGNHSKNTEQ